MEHRDGIDSFWVELMVGSFREDVAFELHLRRRTLLQSDGKAVSARGSHSSKDTRREKMLGVLWKPRYS